MACPPNEVVEFKKLLPCQFKQRFDAAPLAYISIGSLEWHGEHMCLGNDSVKAEELCILAARKGGGIVLPATFLGVLGMTGWAKHYGLSNDGIVNVEPELLKGIITQQLRALDRMGFKGAIVITGHYPEEQVVLARETAKAFKPEHGLKAVGITDRDLARSVGHTGDHAGKWETSILWALRPELLDVTRLSLDPNIPLEGVYGEHPRLTASPELGWKVVNAMVDEMIALGRSLLKT